MTEQDKAAAIPMVLSPAGSRESFLSALAAGADGIYCGLKTFSARMAAANFEPDELVALTRLAHDRSAKVFVTLNTMLKPDDPEPVCALLDYLGKQVCPDGIIVQDLAMVELARQAKFSGEIHLSTLANVSFPLALNVAKRKLKVDRVVIPRELHIDEIKSMAAACPEGLGLEVFVHGALCYAVSGRCYWSSFLGGKSGLRGHCVQPCRRRYSQEAKQGRFFSCMDLSLDVLTKVLKTIPQISAWKIEGRKKGPHYVYYTTRAYRLMRDQGHEPEAKKEALALLEYSLGRTSTHYGFLPQRPQNPTAGDQPTGSGLLLGRVKGATKNPFLVPAEQLMAGDLLRLGYEDDPWHALYRVKKWIPKKGRLYLFQKGKKPPRAGTPVFLIDRREQELASSMAALEKEIPTSPKRRADIKPIKIRMPSGIQGKKVPKHLRVYREIPTKNLSGRVGVWLSPENLKSAAPRDASRFWWWLPPVTWPDDESETGANVDRLLKLGAKFFVANAPWQSAFFDSTKGLNLWAGPFCNIANPLALLQLKKMGFTGAIVSPELGGEEITRLPAHSPLPLGIILAAHWPLCISRVFSDASDLEKPFESPKKERSWGTRHGSNYWIYPDWRLDIRSRKAELIRAGYSLLIEIFEPMPKQMVLKKRPGLWNWEIGLE